MDPIRINNSGKDPSFFDLWLSLSGAYKLKENIGNQKCKENIKSMPYQEAVKRLFAVHGSQIRKTRLESYAYEGKIKPESTERLDDLTRYFGCLGAYQERENNGCHNKPENKFRKAFPYYRS